MKIIINDNEFTKYEMDKWKKKRVKAVLKNLNKDIQQTENADILCENLSKIKLQMSYEEIISLIKVKLAIGRIGMKIAATLSKGKRRASITTIYADGINVERLGEIIDALMLEDTEEHRYINLSAYPDHYVLIPRDGILEVIETAGNSPVPTQFYITFNEENGLQEPRNEMYPYQSTGIAKLKDGTIIGGVRHQFRNTKTGIKARLVVEFPAVCPKTIIRAHQKHLAVEWSNWINWAINHQDS